MRKIALVSLVAMLVLLVIAPMAAAAPDECGTPRNTGICYGDVKVKNMYLGARAEHPVWIYNAGSLEVTFDVYYVHPDKVQWDSGYPPLEARQWVSVGDEQSGDIEMVLVPAHGWHEVLIALELPKTTPEGVSIPKRWEFRIKVIERQQGMIVEAYEQRWVIEMAPPGFSLTLVIGAATGALIAGALIGAYVMRRRTQQQRRV